MKRFLICLFTVFLSFNLLFADEAKGASPWAKPEIQKGLAMGIIDPDLNSSYQSKINRQDFCKLVVGVYIKENGFSDIDELLSHGIQLAQGQKFKFKDLDYGKSDYKYVVAAEALGLVSGFSDLRFAPQNGITREQAARIYANFYKKLALDKELNPDFKFQYHPFLDDAEISSWAKPDVYYLGALKVMEGLGGGRFNPKGAYSREQAFVTTLRVYEAYEALKISKNLKAKTKALEKNSSFKMKDKMKEQLPPAFEQKIRTFKQEVLKWSNLEREKAGVPPLKECQIYGDYADLRACEIEELFEHTRPDGTDSFSGMNDDYSYVGENIAAGQIEPKEVVEDWMKSEGHRKNILNPEFEELNVGIYYDAASKYRWYWVQIFYTPLR